MPKKAYPKYIPIKGGKALKKLSKYETQIAEPVKEYVKKSIIADKKKIMRQHENNTVSSEEVTSTQITTDLTDIDVAGAGVQDNPELYRSQQVINVHDIYISGVVTAKATATIDNFCRLIIFQWRDDPNDNPPGATDLFGTTSFTYPYLAPVGVSIDSNKSVRRVLYDKLLHFGPQDSTGGLDVHDHFTTRVLKKRLHFKNPIKVKYNSGDGSIGNDHIWAFIVGNTTSGINSSTATIDFMVKYTE